VQPCRARLSCSSERFYFCVALASEDAALTLASLEGEWEEKGMPGRSCQEYTSAIGRTIKSSIGGLQGYEFDEINLGQCLFHLYLLFRGVCMAA